MRTILVLCGAILIAGIAAGAWWLSRPKLYGQTIPDAPMIALSAIDSSPETWSGRDVQVYGKLVRQCPATGHWFFLADESGRPASIRIEMDEATLPQKVGSWATVQGRVERSGDGWRIAANAIQFGKGTL